MLDAETAPTTHAILGAAVEVHRHLGPGFMEAVYQDCLAIEFRQRGIANEREADLTLEYKGEVIPSTYRADFVVAGVVLELKAKRDLAIADEAQVINYLRATGLKVGLLLNFGEERLVARRFVNRPKDHGAVADVAASAGSANSAWSGLN